MIKKTFRSVPGRVLSCREPDLLRCPRAFGRRPKGRRHNRGDKISGRQSLSPFFSFACSLVWQMRLQKHFVSKHFRALWIRLGEGWARARHLCSAGTCGGPLCCPRRLAPSPPEACGLRGRPSPPVRVAIMRAAALAAGWAFALLASAAGGSTDAVRLFSCPPVFPPHPSVDTMRRQLWGVGP